MFIFYFINLEPVYSVSVHPELPLALSGGGDDRAFLWDTITGLSVLKEEGYKFNESVSATGFSHDGRYFAAGSLDGEIIVGDSMTGELILNALEGPSDVAWLTWHPLGYALLVGSEDGSAWLFSIPSGNCLNVFTCSSSALTCGMFSPDGKKIVTVSEDATVIVWDPKTAVQVVKYTGQDKDTRFHSSAIHCLVITPDSHIIITGSEDSSIKLTLLNSQKHVASLDGHTGSVESLAISPLTHNILVSGDLDGLLNI